MGIVWNARLPSYRKDGLPVAAIVDREKAKASALAREFGLPIAFESVGDMLNALPEKVIFDVAVPAKHLLEVLSELPDGACVLLQKPMGETLAEAEAILALCRRKRLVAAVNFQLRWSPAMLAARALYEQGSLGTLHDIEVQVSTHTPWDLWTFLADAPRLEILYHSIHYVDLIRSWLGNPSRVYARTVRNPRTPQLAATKSVLVLDYGDWMRAMIATNHGLDYARDLQHSYVQWEGTEGVLRAQMGINLDYPAGKPDFLVYARREDSAAESIPIEGNWFPDAFLGSMNSLQAFVMGASTELPTSVENAIDTMRTVEAAYLSSERGGEPLPLPREALPSPRQGS
ncbi:MAG: Gfo/Idh/MocA family protein [Acidobacteriaceae bacterium]